MEEIFPTVLTMEPLEIDVSVPIPCVIDRVPVCKLSYRRSWIFMETVETESMNGSAKQL